MLNYLEQKYFFVTGLSASLKSMILSSFLVALGSFMVTPFLSIYLKNTIHMDVKSIGLLVAVATFIQFAGGLAGGIVGDKYGLKLTMIFSLSFRTVGFVLLAFSAIHTYFIVPAVLLVAAGSAVCMPANKAYIISSVTNELKPLFLSISSASLNAGMALGPLIAAIFINDNPLFLFLSIAMLFIVITLIHQFMLSASPPYANPSGQILMGQIPALLLKSWRPVLLNVITFYLYFHFQNFMGLFTSNVSSVEVFGWVMLLNFVVLFFLQLKWVNFIAKCHYRSLVAGGFSLMGLGMLIISVQDTPFILLGTVVMTLGQAVLFLRGDLEVVAHLPGNPAMAFGIQRLAAGTGGLLSGSLGGILFSHFETAQSPGMFWVVVAAQCGLAALLCLTLARRWP